MRRFFAKNRNGIFLLYAFTIACVIAWFTHSFSPDLIWTHILLYIFIGGMAFCIGKFIFVSTIHALTVSLGIIVYLLLRFLHLRHPFYAVLLCILLLFVLNMKKNQE